MIMSVGEVGKLGFCNSGFLQDKVVSPFSETTSSSLLWGPLERSVLFTHMHYGGSTHPAVRWAPS